MRTPDATWNEYRKTAQPVLRRGRLVDVIYNTDKQRRQKAGDVNWHHVAYWKVVDEH